MKAKRIFRVLLFLGAAQAASVNGGARAQCPITLGVSYTPAQQLSVADIDFAHFESRSLLFTMNISNTGGTTAYANLDIDLQATLASSGPIHDHLMFVSKTFGIPAGGSVITNLNLGRGGGIKDSMFIFPQEMKDKVQDVALGTGKFPAGTYTFTLKLNPQGCGIVTTEPIVFIIENASRVELRSPRDGETVNQFPLLEFYQDGRSAILTVSEKSGAQSREDAIDRRPPMLEVELNGVNSFLYAGGRPLESGKEYVWRVVEKQLGAGGTFASVTSPIGLFRVSADASANADDAILAALEEMLGPRYSALFTQLRNGGYKLSGHYDLNGTALSQSDLLTLINELRAIADGIDLSLE